MTDSPDPHADPAASGSLPDGGSFVGDPELAALVRRGAAPVDGDPSPVAEAPEPPVAVAASAHTAAADGSTTSKPDADTVPLLPLAAAVSDGPPPPARPRRRRS